MKKTKKYTIILLCTIFILTGCGKKEEKVKVDLNFDDAYYKIATPYKDGVGKNYVVSSMLGNYNSSEVESSLMDISTNYFSINNSLYQEGQFLTDANLKELLDDNHLNKTDDINIDGVTINPKFISYIREQNYLNTNGELKGISIAIALNPYQEYQTSTGVYSYKQIDENTVLEFGKKQSIELLKKLRNNSKLKDKQILIGLFIQSSPDSILPGSFREIGITTTNEIKYDSIRYEYQYLNSNYVKEHDTNSYTAFSKTDENITKNNTNTYLSGKGLYYNEKLKSLEITVVSNYSNKSKIIMLSQMLSEQVVSNFGREPYVKVYIKVNNETEGLIIKEKNSTKANVHVLKG